ncbi:MAG: hypothetical protein AAB134_06670 [Pseudomonadota bacterium]
MKRRFSFTGFMLSVVLIANTFALPLPAAEARKLVLVAGSQSDAAALSPEEVRKLYLGVAVTKDGKTFLPLCNHTDMMAYEVFMQKVMYMSGPAFERALMTRVVRTTSSVRPPEYAAEKELLQALAATPNAVTYMWADKAQAAGLKVVVELWQEK